MRHLFESQLDCSNHSVLVIQSSLTASCGPADSLRAEDSHRSLSLSSCCEEGRISSANGLQTYVKTLTTEEELKEKWIRILLSKATRPVSFQTKRAECYQSVGGGRTSHPQESSASRAYCQEKMRCVKALQRANPHPRQTQGGKKGSRWSPGGAPPDVCVPLHFISTLKLKSFSEWLKQAVEADMHKPSRCSTCEDQQAKLTLHTFLRTRKTLLESRQLQNKLDLHLCNYNSICLVGELLRNLPRASDAPDTVLQTGCKGAME